MKKLNFGKLIENRRFAMIFSLFLAIVAWVVVVNQFDPSMRKTIADIPVTIDISNTQAESLGLEVIKKDPQTISIVVEGKRYVVGNLEADDFIVRAVSLAEVDAAGEYPLKISVMAKTADGEFEIIQTTPKTINVQFDKISKKTLALSAEAPNVKGASGYTIQNTIASPEKIDIKGAEQYIDKLDKAVLVTDISETLKQTTKTEGTLKLYDIDGNLMDNSLFSLSTGNFEIIIPVYTQKTVPLTFKYKNIPTTLSVQNLEYTMTANEIVIAGTPDAINNINEINVGYVDVRQIDIGKKFKFEIPMPSGFKNMSEITDVTIDFSSQNLSTKLLTIGDVGMINQPEGYDIKVITTAVQNVKVVGTTSIVDMVTASDFAATIDFTNQTIKEGSQTIPITINVISKDGIWIVGEYDCTITATKKT